MTTTFEQFADKTAATLNAIANSSRDHSRMSREAYQDGCCLAAGTGIVAEFELTAERFDRLDSKIAMSLVRRASALAQDAARPLTAAGEEGLRDTLLRAVRHARRTWFLEQQSLELA